MQARPPLPFQYVSEPPSNTMPTNTKPGSWGVPSGATQLRGRGQASSRYVCGYNKSNMRCCAVHRILSRPCRGVSKQGLTVIKAARPLPIPHGPISSRRSPRDCITCRSLPKLPPAAVCPIPASPGPLGPPNDTNARPQPLRQQAAGSTACSRN